MYKPLSERSILDIHEGSLEILSEVGIEVENERARKIFSHHGAKVLEGNRITIPRNLVEKAMNQVPSEFTLYGRREENHIRYRQGCFYTSTGGSAMYVLDLDTGRRRQSTCKDLHNIMSLVDELPHIDLISLPIKVLSKDRRDHGDSGLAVLHCRAFAYRFGFFGGKGL